MFKKVIIPFAFILFTYPLIAQEVNRSSPKSNEKIVIYKSVERLIITTKTTTPNVVRKDTIEALITPKSVRPLLSTTNNKSIPILPKDTVVISRKMDSIWFITGDTLVGTIAFDKDKNTFFFSKDTIHNLELKPTDISRFVIVPKKEAEESIEVVSVSNEFYVLESSPQAHIRIYSQRTYKAVLDDGPKYYVIQKKYCLFKNNLPYFIGGLRTKETLLSLVNDCKAVKDGFKNGKYNKNNFIEAITHYNRCNEQK
jgi:hypothetical protein